MLMLLAIRHIEDKQAREREKEQSRRSEGKRHGKPTSTR